MWAVPILRLSSALCFLTASFASAFALANVLTVLKQLLVVGILATSALRTGSQLRVLDKLAQDLLFVALRIRSLTSTLTSAS